MPTSTFPSTTKKEPTKKSQPRKWLMCYKHTIKCCKKGMMKCKHGWHITKEDLDALVAAEIEAPCSLSESEFQEIQRLAVLRAEQIIDMDERRRHSGEQSKMR